MAMTQMNVRIDEDIKAAGDRVFEGLGLTPSQVVRQVWEYAASHQAVPAIVGDAMQSPQSESEDLDKEMRMLMIEADRNRIAAFRRRAAPAEPVVPASLDYKALREEAFLEARSAGEWVLK